MPEVEGNPSRILDVLLALFSLFAIYWFVKSSQIALPRRGYLDPAITPTMAILLASTMFLLGGFGAWWGYSQIPEGANGTLTETAWITAPSILAQLPLLVAYAILRRRVGSRKILTVALIGFVVFAPLALTTAAILHALFSRIGVEPTEIIGHDTLRLLSQEGLTSSALIVIICVTIGAGIIEEVFYRGLILPTFVAVFMSKTPWIAIIVTSILFAFMHLEVVPYSSLGGLFVLSLGLCWARVKSGGVLAPIAIHVVFNTMNIAIVYSTTL